MSDSNQDQKTLRIGTRASLLALEQTTLVSRMLQERHPDLKIDVIKIISEGDKLSEVSLRQIGGIGVFTKELERALLDNKVDLAVHSMKDLPTIMAEELVIGAVGEREDPRDVLVLPKPLHAETNSNDNTVPGDNGMDLIKEKALRCIDENGRKLKIGTSSLRRGSQILANLEAQGLDLVEIHEVRGNVNTRLRKLDEGQYDALILAAAGLKRLSLQHRISCMFQPKDMMHAVSQGALALQCRASDTQTLELLAPLHHMNTFYCCEGERSVLRTLEGGCRVPIGVYTQVTDTDGSKALKITAGVFSPDGRMVVVSDIEGPADSAMQLGADLAQKLKQEGADKILEEVYKNEKM